MQLMDIDGRLEKLQHGIAHPQNDCFITICEYSEEVVDILGLFIKGTDRDIWYARDLAGQKEFPSELYQCYENVMVGVKTFERSGFISLRFELANSIFLFRESLARSFIKI